MERPAQKKSKTGIYHIMVRGINRQTILKDVEGYANTRRNRTIITDNAKKNMF